MKRIHRRSKTAHAAVISIAFVFGEYPSAFGQDVYWAESKAACMGSLVRHSTVGSMAVNDLVDLADVALKVQLDAAARQLYWSEEGSNSVRRVHLDSLESADIITATAPYSLAGFALDLMNGKIYWNEAMTCTPCGPVACPDCPRIQRANLDGSNVETAFTLPAGTHDPSDIAVDPSAGKVYYSDSQNSPYISRANSNGSDAEPLVTTAVANGGVTAIALDLSAGKIYWIDSDRSDPSDSRIRRGNLDGASTEDIASFINNERRFNSIALDPACGWLYCTFSGDCGATGEILRVNMATKAQEIFLTGLGRASGIAVNVGGDRDMDGTLDCADGCPDDPNKTNPGVCGCGVADTDTTGDGLPDCPTPAGGGCCAPGAAPVGLMVAPLMFLGFKLRARRGARRR